MADEPNNVDQTLDNWYDGIAGDNEERAQALSQYDSADAFFEAHDAAVNRDWRAEIAGDDEKFKSKLERFAEPAAFGASYREAEQKIRSGDIGPKAPGEDADETEIKEYRRQIGVPLEAAEYLKELPDGMVIGEDDKELVNSYIERMHGRHVPREVVHDGLQWYYELQEQAQDAQVELDTQQKRDAIDALRDNETGWGKDFRTNMALVNGLLEASFGEEALENFKNGRFGDGRSFFNDVDVMKGLAEIARKLNPVGTIIPNEGEPMKALESEIAEIEALMADRNSEYWKGPKSREMKARYRELIEVRQKSKQAA